MVSREKQAASQPFTPHPVPSGLHLRAPARMTPHGCSSGRTQFTGDESPSGIQVKRARTVFLFILHGLMIRIRPKTIRGKPVQRLVYFQTCTRKTQHITVHPVRPSHERRRFLFHGKGVAAHLGRLHLDHGLSITFRPFLHGSTPQYFGRRGQGILRLEKPYVVRPRDGIRLHHLCRHFRTTSRDEKRHTPKDKKRILHCILLHRYT